MLIVGLISYCIFIILAAWDSFYWHFLKLKLYQFKDTRKEHLYHTLRNVFMLIISICLFSNIVSDYLFYIGLAAVIADLVVLIFDLFLETEARKRFGGLSKWEYVIHVMANGFYFLAIAILINNAIVNPTEIETDKFAFFFNFISPFITIGASISLLLHLYLYFNKKLHDE